LPLKWKQFKHKLKIYLNIQSNFSHKQNNYLLPFSTEPQTESLLIALKWKWFKVIWELLRHNFSHLKTQFQKSFVLLLQNIVVCSVNSGDKISLLLWCVLKPKLFMDNMAFFICLRYKFAAVKQQLNKKCLRRNYSYALKEKFKQFSRKIASAKVGNENPFQTQIPFCFKFFRLLSSSRKKCFFTWWSLLCWSKIS